MKRNLSLLLSLMIVLNLFVFTGGKSFAAEMVQETRATDLYEPLDTVPEGYTAIDDIFDLYYIRNAMDKNYILMADLDLARSLNINGDLYNPEGWIALGYNAAEAQRVAFSGTLDGNGHKIIGLSSNGAGAGLFWQIGNDGIVKNLTIASGEIKGADTIGSFAQANYGLIENCHNYANVDSSLDDYSNRAAGGIVGYNYSSGKIINCSNSGNITVISSVSSTKKTASAGGIAGENLGTLDMVWNHGQISATSAFSISYAYGSMAGGIVGRTASESNTDPASLRNAYNTEAVFAKNTSLTADKSYAHAGGIIGYYQPQSSEQIISCCYNVGEVDASASYSNSQSDLSYIGGIAGIVLYEGASQIYSCYYLGNTEYAIGNGGATGAIPMGPSQMTMKESYSGFDFDEIWTIEDGDYPYPVIGKGDGYEMTYQIKTAEELWAIRSDMSGDYILMNDLDLSSLLAEGGNMYTSEGWVAIGYSGNDTQQAAFVGSLNGNGHKITGLSSNGAGAGLFWQIGKGGIVKNLTIASGEIKGADTIGSFAQTNYGLIENCHNYANVDSSIVNNSNRVAGGIVGYNYTSGEILNCSNSGSVTVVSSSNIQKKTASAGGIAGENLGTLDMVWNHGQISATSAFSISYAYGSMAGGIVGRTASESNTDPASIRNAYNTGAVFAKNTSLTADKSYAHAGGIIGYFQPQSSEQIISCCYNVGEVDASASYSNSQSDLSSIGGIAGIVLNEGASNFTNCYYLNNLSNGFGNLSLSNCTALSEQLMKKQDSFAGFDFVNTWAMGLGDYLYPILVHVHKMTHVSEVESTCQSDGNIEYWYCGICGHYYIDEEGMTLISQEDTVLPGGHIYETSVVSPTCTEEGYTKHECMRCGNIHLDDYVAALGHDPVQHDAKAPTCTEPGWEAYDTCSRCDYTTYAEIPATGHTPATAVEENRVEPTCTKAGSYDEVVYCSACGAELSRETKVIEALSHDWSEWTVTTAPTCTEKGVETRTCSRCDAAETREVEALGHALIHHEAKASTCTEPGWDAYDTCSRCDYTTYAELPATGHDWGEPSYEWAEDYSEITATRICKNDASHVETEKGVITSEVTLEATYDAEGEITYTATFENSAFATQTKAVSTPKLEKPKPSNPFGDVAEGAFYYDAVLWAVSADPQITSGTSETTFSPNATCTRAQVVTFLWRAKGCPEPTKTDNPFTDVKSGAYYYKAVLWAVENEITSGTSKTAFSPNAGCTRAQVVTFLWRAEGKPQPTSTNNPFTDVTGGYYYDAVLWAVENKITSGTSTTKFSPNATCTRGQVVTFLYRDLAG